MLTIALPKGRLGETVYSMLESSGYACDELRNDSRKLVFLNEATGVQYILAKPVDVAVYVQYGAADIGVVGKDILLESRADVYELLDMEVGGCTMVVAGKGGTALRRHSPLRVATKFPNITKEHYDKKNVEIDIIPLNGSIELAPIIELSDVIVDIVETGTTLRENKLEVLEIITPISTRLIANKASYQFKEPAIRTLVTELQKGIEAR